jgi:hypothetical protein
MSGQIFDTYRKASESWFQMQQDLFRSAAQGPFSGPAAWGPTFGPAARPWPPEARKRWVDLMVEIMHRHRESVDALYRSVIHVVEKASQIPEAQSSEEARHATEDLWNSWLESVKNQSESQLRDARRFSEKSLEIVQGGHTWEIGNVP